MIEKIFTTAKNASADRSTSRIINQKALVDAIYESDGISKASLAARLSLSKPAVSSNVADLIAMGLIEEKGEGESSKNGGRKPIMLYFNKSHQYIATVVLSFERPVCAIGDLKYNILQLRKTNVARDAAPEVKKERIAETLNKMLRELNIPQDKLGLIVISHPGIIDWDNKAYYSQAVHFPWTGIGLKDYLHGRFNTPVYLENDMRLASIGEMHMGVGNHLQDLIYVSCGIGLGASVIHKGKPVLGCNRAAGEIGAFLTEDFKQLEDVVAIRGLMERAKKLYIRNNLNPDEITFENIIKLSLRDDILVNQALFEIGLILGKVLYNCCVMFDISTVIFGGDYAKLGPALFKGINETVLHPTLMIHPNVIKSELREAAGVYGAFVVGAGEIINRKLHINPTQESLQF
ncbi:MAG: ROK family transcriptional regulator [Defluviitaleaceae bacterium]|nr:ROK family transcriptional regulator [Defluviitaleaceae bacterium]